MKRSEANAIFRARLEFSKEHDCVSIAKDDDGNDCEEHFSHSGCDICPDGLAGSVIDVVYLSRADIDKGDFESVHEGQLCGACLCSLVNGDDDDLDYHTDDEDEPSLTLKVDVCALVQALSSGRTVVSLADVIEAAVKAKLP